MSDPARTPRESRRPSDPARKPRNGEPDNFVADYFASASPEELQALDELAELDRRHGNKPTPE